MPRRRKSIAGLGKLLERVPAETVVAAELRFAQIAEDELTRDSLRTISINAGGRTYGPYPLVTRVDRARVTKQRASLIVFGSPAGFWTWLEEGVPRHEVGRARSSRSTQRSSGRGGRRQAVDTPQGPRTYAHASFPQRGTWTRVVERFDDELEEVVTDAWDEAVS